MRLARAALLAAALATLIVALAGVALPAAGVFPAAGFETPSLEAWRRLADTPGLARSLGLSLFTGVMSTMLALAGAHALTAVAWGRAGAVGAVARVLLAAPHMAVALAIAFAFAPSGLVARAAAAWTGRIVPADYLFPGDAAGLALILGLTAKELPFLLVVALAAAREAKPRPTMEVAASLGYSRVRAWLIAVAPDIQRRIRWPALAALVYAVAATEQALILGPAAPPTFAVRLLLWFNDPDLAQRLPLAAGALALAALAGGAVALWLGAETIMLTAVGRRAARGRRRGVLGGVARVVATGGAATMLAGLAGLIGLALAAVARDWRYPALAPPALDFDAFVATAAGLGTATVNAAWLALTAAVLAVALALAGLEATADAPRHRARLRLALAAPLFLPEAILLFGLGVTWAALRVDGLSPTLVGAHLIYCLPYAWLMLEGPRGAIDPRLHTTARALGCTPWAVFARVTLPMLRAPLALAGAVAAIVSGSLYLPTLVAGAGRWPTLATEGVALATGGDRATAGAVALLLTGFALVALLVAGVVRRA